MAPQIGIFSFGNEPLNAGDLATVTCAVSKGDLPLEIMWIFNAQQIDEKTRTIIS